LTTQPAYINVRLSLSSLSKSDKTRAEAIKLLRSTLNKLTAAIQKTYNGNALVTVVTTESYQTHSRSKRAADDDNTKYNVASLRSPDYPVIFNIIFWFSLILLFSLLAISLALSNVEDKDSIIYRMTGARGKKEN
jgi:renin receptor